MDEIIGMLQALKDDHPQLIITREIIKMYIENNWQLVLDELIDEIEKEL